MAARCTLVSALLLLACHGFAFVAGDTTATSSVEDLVMLLKSLTPEQLTALHTAASTLVNNSTVVPPPSTSMHSTLTTEEKVAEVPMSMGDKEQGGEYEGSSAGEEVEGWYYEGAGSQFWEDKEEIAVPSGDSHGSMSWEDEDSRFASGALAPETSHNSSGSTGHSSSLSSSWEDEWEGSQSTLAQDEHGAPTPSRPQHKSSGSSSGFSGNWEDEENDHAAAPVPSAALRIPCEEIGLLEGCTAEQVAGLLSRYQGGSTHGGDAHSEDASGPTSGGMGGGGSHGSSSAFEEEEEEKEEDGQGAASAPSQAVVGDEQSSDLPPGGLTTIQPFQHQHYGGASSHAFTPEGAAASSDGGLNGAGAEDMEASKFGGSDTPQSVQLVLDDSIAPTSGTSHYMLYALGWLLAAAAAFAVALKVANERRQEAARRAEERELQAGGIWDFRADDNGGGSAASATIELLQRKGTGGGGGRREGGLFDGVDEEWQAPRGERAPLLNGRRSGSSSRALKAPGSPGKKE